IGVSLNDAEARHRMCAPVASTSRARVWHRKFRSASTSLLNALYPGLDLRIGKISEKWGTGRHTTRAALLVPLAGGGDVVDTPGLREVGTWGLARELLALCSPEFRRFLDHCRFDDCRHLAEPGRVV